MLKKGANLAPKGELEKGGWRDYNMSMTSIKLSENGGKAPEAVPYMPAGLNEICCTVNGRAGKRTVIVDAAACERLNADLQEQIKAHQAGDRARPVILFDHKAGAAAAVPTGFEWDENRGILLRVDWTQAGREAVEGGNYGYISPAFRLAPNSESITGLQDGVEVGSLVNDPAFTRNECIAAAHEVVEDVEVWAANPYGCNQYGHGFREPHNEAGGKGQKTFDFFGGTKDKRRAKDIAEVDNATKAFREAEKEEDEAYKKYEKTEYGTTEEKEAESKWKKANQELRLKTENAKKIRDEARKKGYELNNADDDDIEKILDAYDRYDKYYGKEEEEDVQSCSNLAPFCDIEKKEKESDNIRAANNGSEKTTGNSDMETVKKMLGLGADATPADVAAAIAALKKKGAEGQKRIEEVEAECNEHKKALQEHKEKAADGFIDRLRKSGKVAHKDEETLKAAREMYMENPERTERIYAAMQPICPAEDGGGDKVQANRVPSGDASKMSVADFYANMDF